MYEKVGNILKMARESNTSVISFMCMDFNMARSVVLAAESTNTPALIMLLPEYVQNHLNGFKGYAAMAKELASEVKVPIGFHADHDFSYEAIMATIDSGFDSVMMDGSMNDLDTNIAVTKKVVDKAHELGVIVEGEIGHVGLAAESANNNEDLFTKPEAAEKFVRETKVDSLAISIGNAHGEYKETPHLDIKRLEDINAAANIPLVLHGGSGIPDDQLLVAFSKGINKFNLGTEFMGQYRRVITEFTDMHKDDPNPLKVLELPEYCQANLKPYVEGRLKTLCHF